SNICNFFFSSRRRHTRFSRDWSSDVSSSDLDARPRPGRKRKFNNREQRELEALPGRIEALEAEQAALHTKMTGPDYFRNTPEVLRADQLRHDEIEASLIELLERWEALEARQAGDWAAPPHRLARRISRRGRSVPREVPD